MKKIILNNQVYSNGTSLLMARFTDGKIDTKFDYEYLSDISDQDFSEGIKKILQNYQYRSYPSIATIRFYCGYDLDSVAKYAIDTKMRLACKKIPDYRSLAFTDKALNHVCEQFGGHGVVGRLNDEEWLYKQKAMKEMYSHAIRRGRGLDRVRGTKEKLFESKPFPFQISIVDSVEPGSTTKVIQIGKDKKLVNPEDRQYLGLVGLVKQSDQYNQIENLLKDDDDGKC